MGKIWLFLLYFASFWHAQQFKNKSHLEIEICLEICLGNLSRNPSILISLIRLFSNGLLKKPSLEISQKFQSEGPARARKCPLTMTSCVPSVSGNGGGRCYSDAQKPSAAWCTRDYIIIYRKWWCNWQHAMPSSSSTEVDQFSNVQHEEHGLWVLWVLAMRRPNKEGYKNWACTVTENQED